MFNFQGRQVIFYACRPSFNHLLVWSRLSHSLPILSSLLPFLLLTNSSIQVGHNISKFTLLQRCAYVCVLVQACVYVILRVLTMRKRIEDESSMVVQVGQGTSGMWNLSQKVGLDLLYGGIENDLYFRKTIWWHAANWLKGSCKEVASNNRCSLGQLWNFLPSYYSRWENQLCWAPLMVRVHCQLERIYSPLGNKSLGHL